MHQLSATKRRATVLVVEDEPLLREEMIATLEDAGIDVLGVAAAEDAIGLALMDVSFDLIFTDINLAGHIDGWELAEVMREMRPSLPVVYASAQDDDAGARVADSIFIPKPYNPSKVAALIERQTALEASIREAAAAVASAMEPKRFELRRIA